MEKCPVCGSGWDSIMNYPTMYVCGKCDHTKMKASIKAEQVREFKKEDYLNESPVNNSERKWFGS
jgi:hypothetical protein